MNKASTAAREKWSRIIVEQRASGLGVARFCEERRIPASSFFPWRKRLRDMAPARAFVEARVGGGGGDDDHRRDGVGVVGFGGVAVEVAGGRRVVVSRGFDRQLLLEVIGALEPAGGGA